MPPNNQPFNQNGRQNSFGSIKRSATNFLTGTKTPKPKLVQQSFPVYRFDWDKLKTWLVREFPGYEFERVVRDDSFIFNVPRELTDADKDAIENVRDK